MPPPRASQDIYGTQSIIELAFFDGRVSSEIKVNMGKMIIEKRSLHPSTTYYC